jgi:hypothetical protein
MLSAPLTGRLNKSLIELIAALHKEVYLITQLPHRHKKVKKLNLFLVTCYTSTDIFVSSISKSVLCSRK